MCEMNNLRLNSCWVDLLSVSYLMAPLILFLLGWIQWFVSVPLICALLYGCYSVFFNTYLMEVIPIKCYLNKKNLIVVIGILCVLFFAGLSGDWSQHSDWFVRNDIFYDLIASPWPIVCCDGTYPVYYFASFLPAAFVGKLCGWESAERFYYLWSVFGMILVIYYVIKNVGFSSIWIFVCWLVWNGAEVLPGFVYGYFSEGQCVEYHSDYMFAPFLDLGTAELLRSFPYAYIPSALAISMSMLPALRIPFFFFFAASVVLYNPIASMFYFFIMCAFFYSFIKNKNIRNIFNSLNIVSILIILVCLFPFYISMDSAGVWHCVGDGELLFRGGVFTV